MKRVRLTAFAEFDLVEAQDFYALRGAWVLDHFMDSINEAFTDLADYADGKKNYHARERQPRPGST